MKPRFFPAPDYYHAEDVNLANWDDESLRYGLSYYVSRARDPQNDFGKQNFYQTHADLVRAEMLARKLTQ